MLLDSEGTFRAKLVGKEMCRSKGGAEQLALRFEVTAGDKAGAQITEFLSFSDAALKYTVEKMRTCGWSGADLADLETLGSTEVEIVVRMKQDPGYEPRMRVQFINSVGGGAVAVKSALSDSEKRAFAAKMRAAILGLDPSRASQHAAARPQAPARPPAQPQRRPEPPPVDDGDVPF
jgi:hypothetical protein